MACSFFCIKLQASTCLSASAWLYLLMCWTKILLLIYLICRGFGPSSFLKKILLLTFLSSRGGKYCNQSTWLRLVLLYIMTSMSMPWLRRAVIGKWHEDVANWVWAVY
jgi:hypothetical protein